MKKIFICCIAAVLALTGCKKNLKEMVMPEATGSPYDLYVFMPEALLQESAIKDTIKTIFEYPMECIPQGDPYFKLYFMKPDSYKSPVIRVVGNILLVDIDPSNASEPFVTLDRDVYSQSQVIIKAHAKSMTELANYLPQLQESLRDVFVKAEINRAIKRIKEEPNRAEEDSLTKKQKVQMSIPYELGIPGVSKDPNFFWTTNDGQRKRSDIVVYSVPYTDANVFTLEGAVAVRDSVMKANIEGGTPDSYMTTHTKIIKPEYKALNVGGKYVGELKGWWRLENGLMAGPFICHIRLDELNKRVVFAEGFVYAPNDDKRNLIRNLEAAIYTLKLPSDNMAPEISITLDTNE